MLTSRVVRKTFIKVPRSLPGPKQVKVGFPAGAADSDNIQKAIWNEFGTKGGGWGGPIPERPFMRNASRNNRGKYTDAMRKSALKLLRSETTLSSVLSKLGILAQGDIQAEITSIASPPNSPTTIELKGSSNPLVDTGEMRKSVAWKVDE